MRLLAVFLCLQIAAQVRAGVTDELLELPAPARDWRTDPRVLAHATEDPPPADAPVEELLAFWASHWEEDSEPDEATHKRLVTECEINLRLVPRLLSKLPDSLRAYRLVQRWLAAGRPGGEAWDFEEEWFDWWGLQVDPAKREELFRRARETGDSDLLEVVAQIGGEEAWRLLRARSAGDGADSLHAAALLFWNGPDDLADEALPRLLRAGADPDAHPARRIVALRALRDAKWPGRETWWRERIEDPTLCNLTDEIAPLLHLERDRWWPVVVSLTARADPRARIQAVSLLLSMEEPRPLLPWLRDPDWCAMTNRVDFVQMLQRTPLPEAADALWELRGSDEEREAALLALAKLGDRRAGPTLIARFTDDNWMELREYYEAIRACGGISAEQAIGFIEALAIRRHQTGDYNPFQTRPMLGHWIEDDPREIAEPVADGLIARADEGPVGDAMRAIAYGFKGSAMAADFVARLSKGAIEIDGLRRALANRAEIRAHVDAGLRLITGGESAGFAAAILEDVTVSGLRLRSDDAAAARALLAAARIARIPLSIEAVRTTLGLPELQRAALLYLVAADTPESHAALRAHFADRALLLGGWDWDFPSRELGEIDDALAMPVELLEEFSTGAIRIDRWSRSAESDRDLITVRCLPDRVEYAFSDAEGREWYRDLEQAEWASLCDFLDSNRVADIPSYSSGDGGVWHGYVHATPAGGVFVGAHNPAYPDAALYVKLDSWFTYPYERGEYQLRYAFANAEPLLEVLFARRDRDVRQFRIENGEILIELGPRIELDAETTEWRRIVGGELTPPIPDPMPGYEAPNERRFDIEGGELWFDRDLKFVPEEGATRVLLKHVCWSGLLSSDRRWLLTGVELGSRYSKPIQLYLVDLMDLSTRPAGRRAHPEQDVLCWLPAHTAFLCKDGDGNHFLIDPTASATATVQGEFRPLDGRRDPERVFWTHFWDNETETWRVGRYDTTTFSFHETRRLPGNWRRIDQIHVEAKRNLLYVLYEGHLLRMPLRSR